MLAGRLAELLQGVGENEVYTLKAELFQHRLGAALGQRLVRLIEIIPDRLLNGSGAVHIHPKAVLVHLRLPQTAGVGAGVGVQIGKISRHRRYPPRSDAPPACPGRRPPP